MIGIYTPDQQTVQVKANADTGGSKNLASKHLLQNVKTAEEYGNKPICMVTIQGDSPAYTHQGELQFSDENGNPLILLCYVQERPIPGHEHFVLISNNTLVDIDADINFHARASKEIGVLPLRRTTTEAYHYRDKTTQHARGEAVLFSAKGHKAPAKKASIAAPKGCQCQPTTIPNLKEVGIYRFTRRRPRASRKGRSNPKKDKTRIKSSLYFCYMSEIELQGLLDRTNPLDDDPEAMDMITIDGVRISKFDIRALKVGENVPFELNEELKKFNSGFLGKESVFPTTNGAPRILTQYKDEPYTLELLDQYTTTMPGRKPKPLPTIKANHHHGKPATSKVLEHFVRTTPVVERCDDPRCFSRLVIVPKRDPGTTKDSPPTSYRVTMDALINNCLKPVASTLPLATDEIKKLHGKRFFLKLDAMHAFWAIPLDEESKKLMAFQTHEGVFAWSRLTMGCRPASQVQQTAFHNAMDKYMPPEFRHRIALYADDMAAGADTLEELFEIYKALVITLDKAGIQVKASKVEFGVEEVTFHNYRVIGGTGPNSNTTTPKDENLDPIQSCSIPQTVTQLKAFLGATQQMAAYVPYYALVASPLHALTKKDRAFPTGSKWIPGSDYDLAYHHVKSLILDRPLYLWNKNNEEHLFFEVDSSDDGWGACAFQYADKAPSGEDEGKHHLLSKKPKRIIAWISKAWTTYEKKSLPIFYKETIARLLTFEHYRNLIESQSPGAGVTCYSDHLPGIKNTSLSNKGKLSTWKIHEVSDLTSIVETIYKAGPTMAIADPLSRLARQEDRVENLDLPVLLEMLLRELPPSIKMAERIRVNAEKDTYVVTRIVQRWRTPANPISNTIGASLESFDFLIAAPYADKLPLKVAEYIRKDIPFAILIPLPLLNEIDRTTKTEIDPEIRRKRAEMKLIVSSSLGQAWLVNHPECRVKDAPHSVFFTQLADNPELTTASQKIFSDWSANYLGYDEIGTQSFMPSVLPGGQNMDELALLAIDSLFRDGPNRTIGTTLLGEINSPAKPSTRDERAAKRAKPAIKSIASKPTSKRDGRATKRKQRTASASQVETFDQPEEECERTGKHPVHVISTATPPKSITLWPELQNPDEVPSGMELLPPEKYKTGWPKDLIVLTDKRGTPRILVPECQRIALIQTEHETMLHVKGHRVNHELSRSYYWPRMTDDIKAICSACTSCKEAEVRRQHLSAVFRQAEQDEIPLPRQAYGIDFYGHAKGEILVAVDLCTREATLWFLPNRKQDNVARALLTGLIFQKGVPLMFRNDEAAELVEGTVAAMNSYLRIQQITTGGHNPRSNAVVERFMQHLTACLTKCDDSQYGNMRDYLPAIAFAHNTAFNSSINCTPFEAGHGLRARTITEARANPRLQITADGGMDIDDADKNWEKTIFPKVCKLAERLASEAQRHSQWHKRMNAQALNQAGEKTPPHLQIGDRVYFYRPPTQQEVIKRTRKAKHLAHYHGPATILSNVDGRERQYNIEYLGKVFKRDIGMLIPEKRMQQPGIRDHDPTMEGLAKIIAKAHDKDDTLQEGILILCKTQKEDKGWYLAEIDKIYPDEIEVTYYATPRPSLDNYETSSKEQRMEALGEACFRKTWYIRQGKNAGMATNKAPFPQNPELRLWKGKLPLNEREDLILAIGITLDPKGLLSKGSLQLASQLDIGHDATETVEDKEEQLADLRIANSLFCYAEAKLCNCSRCITTLTQDKK
jgi:transposase InsO family protein